MQDIGYGNIIAYQSTYTTNTLTGNMDHNITITLPDKPLSSIALGFMISYTPTNDWDTKISLRAPVTKDGILYLHIYGATAQKYSIQILWLIDARYAY